MATVPKSARASITAGERPATIDGGARGTPQEDGRPARAEGAGGFQGRFRLFEKRRPGQEVDVGIEDEGHHEDDPPKRGDVREPDPRSEDAAEPALHGAGVIEEPAEDKADDIGGHRQRQEGETLEGRPAGGAGPRGEPRE